MVTALHQPGNPDKNPPTTGTILQGSIKWDGVYYVRLAETGYPAQVDPTYVFYPGYPLILRAVHASGLGMATSVTLINIVGILLATVGLYSLALLLHLSRRTAFIVVASWLAFPASFFMMAAYTEAVFCALSVWALVFVMRGKTSYAVLLAALASFVRLPGLILGLVIIYEYVRVRDFNWRKLDWQVVLLPLSFAGAGLYWIWLWGLYGNPFTVLREAYAIGWPYMGIQLNVFKTFWMQAQFLYNTWFSTSWADDWINQILIRIMFIMSWLAIAWSALLGYKRNLPSFLYVYSGAVAVMLLLTGNFISHNRYALPVFPIFILIGMWLSKQGESTRVAYFMLSAMALGALLTVFYNGFWAG